MLDGVIRRWMDPPLNVAGRWLACRGASANQVTVVGLVLGLGAALLVAVGASGIALIPLLASRLADGLDGAVARATQKSDFGGYFDIACDFLFYGAIPVAFVFADPASNGAAGAFLICSFYFNGTTFLGYAILAEKHALSTSSRGSKSLYFTGGLLEGSETIGFFTALCLWPSWFSALSWVFGTLCFFTALSRILLARQVFSQPLANSSDNDRQGLGGATAGSSLQP